MAFSDKSPKRGNWVQRNALRFAAPLAAMAFALTGCAPGASSEKPPATGPAVPGETSAPSEGNPVETPDNGEKDPLSPENLWSMSEKEQLEAVRIPEGTSPEEWVQLYAKYKEALLNAAASDKAFQEWDADGDKNGRGVSDCSKFVYNKIKPGLYRLSGGPIDENGYPRLVLYRACARNLDRKLTNNDGTYAPPKITYKAEMVKEGYKGGVVFNSYFYDNVTEEDIAQVKKDALNEKNYMLKDGSYVMSKEPATLVADTLDYNEKEETIQPGSIYPAPKNI